MPDQPTPETPEAWDAASRGYAEKVAPYLMNGFAAELVDRLGVDPTSEVIEVGAGSGALTEALHPRVGSLLATDFSPQMIELLRRRMASLGAANVQAAVMDGQALEVADDRFDAGACMFALMLFPDRAKGFSELRRVVRPGGRVVVSGWAGPDRFEALGLLLAAMNAAFPDMPQPPEPPAVFRLADPAAFKGEMEAAGFRDVEVDLVARGLELASVDHLWSMLTVGAPPVQVLLDRVGDAGKQRLRDSLARIVAERFGDGPISTTNHATIGYGVAT